MSDRLSHTAALANAEPRAREPSDRTPDFTGRSATLALEDIEVPFGVLYGEVEIEGGVDGLWSVVEVRIPLSEADATYPIWHRIGYYTGPTVNQEIFSAFASAVTDDMAYDALKQTGE